MATMAAAAALTALGACDRFGPGRTAESGAATGNAAAASAPAGRAAGAGAGGEEAAGGGAGLGGKDQPGAIRASAGMAPGAGATVDRAYVLGRWTDDEDCENAIDFIADGSFRHDNGDQGVWNLAGDRLTMESDRTFTVQLVPIDQNSLTVVNADGSLGRSTRC